MVQYRSRPQNSRHHSQNFLSTPMFYSFSPGVRVAAGTHEDRRLVESALYSLKAPSP